MTDDIVAAVDSALGLVTIMRMVTLEGRVFWRKGTCRELESPSVRLCDIEVPPMNACQR